METTLYLYDLTEADAQTQFALGAHIDLGGVKHVIREVLWGPERAHDVRSRKDNHKGRTAWRALVRYDRLREPTLVGAGSAGGPTSHLLDIPGTVDTSPSGEASEEPKDRGGL